MRNEKGFTLVEVLAACVVLTILMTVLIKGVLTAGSWFAESERIKREGEITANRVEGGYDASVSVTETAVSGLSLQDADGRMVSLGGGTHTKRYYTYGENTFTVLKSWLEGGGPSGSDAVYEPTRDSVKEIQKIYEELLGALKNPEKMTSEEWLKAIQQKFPANAFPEVEEIFRVKYNLEKIPASIPQHLTIGIWVYSTNPGDQLYYMGKRNQGENEVYLIFEPEERIWYRVPKGQGAEFDKYKVYDVAAGSKLTSVESYARYERDDEIYLHENSTNIKNTVTITSAKDVLDFIKNPENGCEALYPEE